MTRARERGAATLQWVGVTAVGAVVVLGISLVASDAKLGDVASAAVCSVQELAPCAVPAGASADNPTGDTGDRRDQERGTRDDRRGRGEDKSPDDPGTPGPDNGGDALGDPVPGTTVPAPGPPPWEPADEGAGEYDSKRAWPWDHAKKLAIEAAANALAGIWPDASRNMSHYLANTGEPLEQDVNRILQDVPSFQAKVDDLRTRLGEDAVERARQSGATGPITFPVSTNWQGHSISEAENANWFFALGSVSYNLTGEVTAYPPASPGGAWRYQVSTVVNMADQYNWDTGKSVEIAGITIEDTELARLHLQGLAREYRNQGRSDTTTTEGTVP